MINVDTVCFNIAAFIGGLFVLEKAADKFVDHTAKLATRLRVPSTLIALLTAGAEWEEASGVIFTTRVLTKSFPARGSHSCYRST